MDIYVQKDGQQLGPFSETKIRQGVDAGEFIPTDLASNDGRDWIPLADLLPSPVPTPNSSNPAFASSPAPEAARVNQTDGNLAVYALASTGLSGAALLCAFGDHKVLWFLGTLSGIILGHYVLRLTREELTKRFVRRWAHVGILIGYGTTSIYLAFLMLMLLVGGFSPDKPVAIAQTQQVRIEEGIKGEVQAAMDKNKQQIFDAFHPMGTAKSVTVHDVSVTAWKHGKDTNRIEDVQQLGIRYTLYWSTPLTEDGFTKLAVTFDAESQRYTDAKILATNGVTNQDAQGAVGTLVGALLQYQAQKAGAQEAANQYYQNH